MTEEVGASIDDDFARLTGPYRPELLAHCYRMLGSVHDAEDLLQETLLRAWRAFDRYDEGRASVRTWLYRIATNACLTALEQRGRRPLPSGLVAPSDDPRAPLVPAREVPWLQPFPEDPAVTVAGRADLRLAFVAALQYLPPRQRAVLIMREVLEWSAAEVAEFLETSPAAVNSALQRARAQLGTSGGRERLVDPADPEARRKVDRYVTAFEKADVDGLRRLLTEDAILEMPPALVWYAGRDAYAGFIARVYDMRGTDWHMVRTIANGQPALAAYLDGRLHTLQILSVTAEGISHNVVYQDPAVFSLFRLAETL